MILLSQKTKEKSRKIRIANSRKNKIERPLNYLAFRADLPYNRFEIMCPLILQIQSIPNPTINIFWIPLGTRCLVEIIV